GGDVAAPLVLAEEARGLGARIRCRAQDVVARDQAVREKEEKLDRAHADPFDGAPLEERCGEAVRLDAPYIDVEAFFAAGAGEVEGGVRVAAAPRGTEVRTRGGVEFTGAAAVAGRFVQRHAEPPGHRCVP